MTLPAFFFVSDVMPAPTWTPGYPRDKVSDDTTIELDVTNVPDATGYRFYGSLTPGFTPGGGNLLASPATSDYEHTGLSIGQVWYYRARGFNVGMEGELSVEASATVLPRVPGVPTVSAARVSSVRIDVTISAGSPDTAVDYGLQRRGRVCGGSYGGFATIDAHAPAGVYQDGTVLEGYEYEYQARGQNTGGDSAYSAGSSAKAYDVPVTGVWTATYPKKGTPPETVIDWSFAAGTGTVDGYDVRYRIQGDAWPGTPQVEDTASLSGSFTSLLDGTTYELTHRARNDCGAVGSWSSTGTVTTDTALPLAPTSITIVPKQGTSDTVTVDWTPAVDADDHDVFLSLATMPSPPTGGTQVGGDTSIPPVDVDVASLISATGNDQIFGNVRGTNGGGDGPFGTEADGYTHRTSPGIGASLDETACPSIEFDLTFDHDNDDADTRLETFSVERRTSSVWSAISGSPFAAGTTANTDTGATTNTDRYRTKYTSESTYAETPVSPICPE